MKHFRKSQKIENRLLALLVCLMMTSASGFSQETPKLNDAEIAHVGVVANQIDLTYAAIAKEKSKNKDVINFAETMARDHSGVIEQATALASPNLGRK